MQNNGIQFKIETESIKMGTINHSSIFGGGTHKNKTQQINTEADKILAKLIKKKEKTK